MKSACPGVSIRLMLCGIDDLGRESGSDEAWVFVGDGGHENVIAADWMVMPLARSAGRKSVTVLPSSTSAICQKRYLTRSVFTTARH